MGPKKAALMPRLTSTTPVTHRDLARSVGSASAADCRVPTRPGSGTAPGMSDRLMAVSPWNIVMMESDYRGLQQQRGVTYGPIRASHRALSDPSLP
jgi:hypothetical protein